MVNSLYSFNSCSRETPSAWLIRVHLCYLWENKDTIRMVKSVSIRDYPCAKNIHPWENKNNHSWKSMHVLNGKAFICNKNGLFTFTIKRTNHDKEITPSYPQQVSPPLLANPRLHRPQARSRTRRPSLILRNTIKTKFYINFALMNCGTFHAIFISFVNVTGLKP